MATEGSDVGSHAGRCGNANDKSRTHLQAPLALIARLGTTGAALSNTAAGPLAAISAITGDVTVDLTVDVTADLTVDLTVSDGIESCFSNENADTLGTFKRGDRVSVGCITVGDGILGLQIYPLTWPQSGSVGLFSHRIGKTGTPESAGNATITGA